MLPPVERWLATLFDPEHADTTVAALADAAENDPAMDARAAAARKRLADAEAKLGRLRAALETGPPTRR